MEEIVEGQDATSHTGGYLAAAASGGPAVLLVGGPSASAASLRAACDRLALDGFVALVPEMSEPADVVTELSRSVDRLLAEPAVTSATVGLVGFGAGALGCYALAARRPDVVTAIAPFCGAVPGGRAIEVGTITAAVQGHHAAHDAAVPPEAARELEAELRSHDLACEIFVYDGTERGFFDPERPAVYDEVAATAAWDRTIAFLRAKVA